MTGNDQLEQPSMRPHHAQRNSLKRYVTEKWGSTDDTANEKKVSVEDESESESVAKHFRAALSNAALKLRFPCRQKEHSHASDEVNAKGSVSSLTKAHRRQIDDTSESDDETEDGRSIFSALSKTASGISATIRRGTNLIRTPSQRSVSVQSNNDESQIQALIGTEICSSNFSDLENGIDFDSSASTLGSNHDSSESTPTPETTMTLTRSPSSDHRQRSPKSKASSNGHPGRSKRSTKPKRSNEEKQERSHNQRKEKSPKHNDTHKKSPSSKPKHCVSPTRKGVERAKSLNKEHKFHEPRGHRVTGSKCPHERRTTHKESHDTNKRRGVQRSKSDDLVRTKKQTDKRSDTLLRSPAVSRNRMEDGEGRRVCKQGRHRKTPSSPSTKLEKLRIGDGNK